MLNTGIRKVVKIRSLYRRTYRIDHSDNFLQAVGGIWDASLNLVGSTNSVFVVFMRKCSMEIDLCGKLDHVSASVTWNRHLISKTNYLFGWSSWNSRIYNPTEMWWNTPRSFSTHTMTYCRSNWRDTFSKSLKILYDSWTYFIAISDVFAQACFTQVIIDL